MRAQISNRDYEQISAYIDGQLSSNEQRKLEERLRTRPELQTVVEDLRRTKTLLRMAPHRRAPRNFILTPAMVGQEKAKRTQSTFFNLFPALSFASALAAIALVISLVFELLPGSPASISADRQANQVAMAPMITQSGLPTEDTLTQGQVLSSTPVEGPAIESADQATPEPSAKLAEKSAEEPSGDIPPVYTWNNNQGGGGGGGEGILGKGVGEYAPAPNNATGMGGGAPGQSLPGGAIVIPLEGVNSIDNSQPSAEATNPPLAQQDTFAEQGGGPILGIPPADQGGEIANKSSWGAPLEGDQRTQPAAGVVAIEQPLESRDVSMRLVQIILGILAVLTGAAAYVLRRKKTG
jgi:hypothetical protein